MGVASLPIHAGFGLLEDFTCFVFTQNNGSCVSSWMKPGGEGDKSLIVVDRYGKSTVGTGCFP